VTKPLPAADAPPGQPEGESPAVALSPCHLFTLSPCHPPVGLVAGAGRLPVYFAEKARSVGLPVVCLGIRHMADPVLRQVATRFEWTGVAQLGRVIRTFQRERVARFVMAGKVLKTVMFQPWRWLTLLPDWRMLRGWYRFPRRDNRDDAINLWIIAEFARDGIVCESPLDLCPELLVNAGLLTRRRPTPKELADIDFGWDLAKEMGRLDVGQSVSVKERAVLAVEAVEGTDRSILRAGELCRAGGFTVVKVAKPHQDMRFDVPTVGVSTIETMKKAGGRVLAIEAGKTIILDQQETVALADRYGLTIVALEAPAATPP
jgi:UDP-2,3-diacylglucosamine hydrolase